MNNHILQRYLHMVKIRLFFFVFFVILVITHNTMAVLVFLKQK